jgi:hypothetical protein
MITGKRVVLPEFEIVANPVIRIASVSQRRFNLIDRFTSRLDRSWDEVIVISNKGKIHHV